MTPTATVCLMSRTANLNKKLSNVNCDGLTNTPSEGRVVGEGLDTHGLAGSQQDDGGVTRLDELRVVLSGLTGTAVNLLLDLGKLEKSSLE